MRRLFVMMISEVVVGVAFVSCQQEPVISRPPKFEKPLLFTLDDPKTIVFNNQIDINVVTSCKVGDTVTVDLPTTYTGTYIYKTVYEWTSNSDLLGSKTIKQIAPCEKDSLPPKWTFVAPQVPGEYEVYFKASFSYSAQTENGQIFGYYPLHSGNHGYEDEGKGKSSVFGILTVVE